MLRQQLQDKIDNLNKPKGSLGRLESLAMQIGLIQQTLSPTLTHPCHILFGADHGIEREGVSFSPREVTWQQMINYGKGGGGINMFCRQHGFKLRVVDVGVDYDFDPALHSHIIPRKIDYGTRNFLYEPAMTAEQYEKALAVGAEQVDACHAEGCNVISFGEMGIANTSPSSIFMHIFLNIPLQECVGAGSGLNSDGVRHKYEVLQAAVENFYKNAECGMQNAELRENAECGMQNAELRKNAECRMQNAELRKNAECRNVSSAEPMQNAELGCAVSSPNGNNSAFCILNSALNKDSALNIVRYFGGFEMVAAIGGMLRAAEHRMVIMVDGFIMTACMLAASRLRPEVMDFAVFGHCGDEGGHRRMLDAMHAEPLLHLGLRLGEGTGAVCAYPIVVSAVNMINEMDNFSHAEITKYF